MEPCEDMSKIIVVSDYPSFIFLRNVMDAKPEKLPTPSGPIRVHVPGLWRPVSVLTRDD